MPKKLARKTSLLVALIFLLTMVLNGTSTAQVSAFTVPFKDVKSNHWGFKDIVKMHSRGVVSGYNDSSFQPNKPVTQIEAVLMAVKNMAVPEELAAVDINQPIPVSVPRWVENGNKREVLLALQKGLIVPAENNFNATSNASRAWITQLMVRMIGKNSEAAAMAETSSSVADAYLIPAWATGYINVAFKYKLIAGYPDNTFKPNQNVTRAEMVAFLSRGEQYLSLGQVVATGKIVSISGQNLTLLVNNSAKSYTVDTGVWVFDSAGKQASTSVIKTNDIVKAVLNGSVVKYIEVLPADAVLTTVKGTVLQVLSKDNVIVIRDDKQNILTKTLANSATVSSQSGDINSLSQVVVGNQVELSLNSADNVVAVLVLNSGLNGSSNGIIYEINQDQKIIIVKNSSGKFNTYQYTDQVTVKIPDVRFPTVKDLQAGDEVKLVVASGIISQIELVQAKQQLALTAKVMVISTEKRIITVQKDNGSLEALPVSDGVRITISGSGTSKLSDVLVNDSVELTVEKGIATAITVKDRNAEVTIRGTVSAVDTTNKIITIKTEKDELRAYEVSSRAQFLIDDSTTTSMYDIKKDMKVEIQLVDNKVIYLETKNTIIGNVVSVDENRHLMTILNNSSNQSYVLSSSVDVDIEGESSAALHDISKDDYVELRVEDNVVTKINVQKMLNYQVLEVFKSSNEIKVKEPDNDTRYFKLSSGIDLVVPGVTNPDVEDFAAGDVIKATFLGYKLTKIEVAPYTRGKITAINSSQNTVTIQAFDGMTKTYTFSNKCEVVNGSSKFYNINGLMVGDRLQVKEKTDGGFTFSVMTKVSGKFQSYTDDGGKIYISKDPMTWLNYYVSAKANVHYGSQTMTLRNLTKDDTVDLYILDDTVYEVEKK